MPATATQMSAAVEAVLEMDIAQLQKLSTVINNAYAVQRRLDASRVLASLEVKDRVVIGNVKPKYLQGKTGEVHEIANGKVTVKLDIGPFNKFRDGMVTFRSASCLKKVS